MRFLVQGHAGHQVLQGDVVRYLPRQARPAHQRLDALQLGVAQQAPACRQGGRLDHPDGHGLAVEEPLVCGECLQRVADGVAEVEDGAAVVLAFVLFHHRRLDAAGNRDCFLDRGRLRAHQRVHLLFQKAEVPGVLDDRVLDHLGHAGGEFAWRQRPQRLHVDDHQAGLMEGADEVLALVVVDRGLPAHAGVHLRQQGGGDLDVADAAQKRGRGEPGDVPDDPSAQGDQRGAPVDAPLHQRIVYQSQGGRVLVRLSLRDQHQHGLVARVPEGVPDLLRVQAGHHRVRHDGDAATDTLSLHELAQARKQAFAQLDGIRALSQADGYGLHSCCWMRCTTSSSVSSSVSTATWDSA